MKENKNDQKPLLTGSSDDQASSSKSFLGLTNTKSLSNSEMLDVPIYVKVADEENPQSRLEFPKKIPFRIKATLFWRRVVCFHPIILSPLLTISFLCSLYSSFQCNYMAIDIGFMPSNENVDFQTLSFSPFVGEQHGNCYLYSDGLKNTYIDNDSNWYYAQFGNFIALVSGFLCFILIWMMMLGAIAHIHCYKRTLAILIVIFGIAEFSKLMFKKINFCTLQMWEKNTADGILFEKANSCILGLGAKVSFLSIMINVLCTCFLIIVARYRPRYLAHQVGDLETFTHKGTAGHKIRKARKKITEIHKDFKILFVLCVICFVYGIVTTYAPKPWGDFEPSDAISNKPNSSGCKDGLTWCMCPRAVKCADRLQDLIYISISRGIIYAVYPYILFLFLSKAGHLMSLLQGKIFSVYFDFTDMHNIHKFGGKLVEGAAWVHVIFHLIRWGTRGEMGLLMSTDTGMTGLTAAIVMPFIVWPMRFEFIKRRLEYEYRKGLHYLSWIWGLAIVFHAPPMNVFWVMGSAVLVYALNFAIGLYWGTFLIEKPMFRRLGTGTYLSFENPHGFKLMETGGGYILVMLPWIRKHQWHAFSVFPHSKEKNTSCVCIGNAGDWSEMLHEEIKRPTHRPAWISGPFVSPFSRAIDYDNIITIASGIGITAALAVIDRLKSSRRVNLVWICRDMAWIDFFVTIVDFPVDAFVLIFYTGREKLTLGSDVPLNVFIFTGRPVLENVITSIVHRVENKIMLPEDIIEEGSTYREMSTEEKIGALVSRILVDYGPHEFFEAASVVVKNEKGITPMSLQKAISDFYGIFEVSTEEMKTLFAQIDADNSGVISQKECMDFLIDREYVGNVEEQRDKSNGKKLGPERWNSFLSKHDSNSMLPFAKREIQQNINRLSSEQLDFVRNSFENRKTWQMLYCGGAEVIISSLEKISKDYEIDLRVEKFDW